MTESVFERAKKSAPLKITVSVSLSADLKAEFENICKIHGVSMASVLEELVGDTVRKYPSLPLASGQAGVSPEDGAGDASPVSKQKTSASKKSKPTEVSQ